ncbi:hypothetical protein Pyn_31658 [Prunus yedoensis var. nudiflora]|uniref:Uncharacterized protein n=1 Tax=Prunus yedoensis var. nudiflora TaxID=2094558 RepID=A0A314XP80_PRUYE|nr:hypothetical protein Pyn_31658 [Prunus yedoensis var. nudiflora]
MATNPGTENLFETAPFGAGASEGDPETEEEGEAAGKDDGGEGGESATGDDEGAAEVECPKEKVRQPVECSKEKERRLVW